MKHLMHCFNSIIGLKSAGILCMITLVFLWDGEPMTKLNKRLLYCASTNRHLQHFHLPYIEMLGDTGITVDILAAGSASDFPNHTFYDVPFAKSITSPKNIKNVLKIRKIISENHYDYIILNTSLTAALVRLALPHRLIKKTMVINICHGYFFGKGLSNRRNFLYRTIEKVLSNRTDFIITMNGEDNDDARVYKLSKHGVFFVHGMGYNAEKFKYSTKKKTSKSPVSLFYAAEHSVRKNHTVMLNAVAQAVSRGADLRLSLAGDGKLLEANKQLCESLDISDRVNFLGYIDHIVDEYQKHDYVVSTSKIEGLPFNIMEALACGLPCVVSDIKGHRDLVTDGENGYVFALDDLNRLTDILCGLTNSDDAYRAMCDNAAASVAPYTLEAVKKEFNAVFHTILK